MQAPPPDDAPMALLWPVAMLIVYALPVSWWFLR